MFRQKKALEREELLIDLKIEELREKEEQKLRVDMERELRKRINTRLVLEQQRCENRQRLCNAEEEDRVFRVDMMKVLAEKDKLDQLSNEKRRRKMMEHKKAIHDGLQQRRIKREQELEEMLQSRKIEDRDREYRQKIVDEERLKMLKEHASALIGFLPRGVLRESDREFIPLEPRRN